MRERLRRGGLRAISPVVDVTNYVLLELGQPMHGFDLPSWTAESRCAWRTPASAGAAQWRHDRRCARTPWSSPTPTGRGAGRHHGRRGDRRSVPTTRDILLESAFFAPLAISGKARSYGLHTDSSHRFERGVDPQLQVRAIERATPAIAGHRAAVRPGRWWT